MARANFINVEIRQRAEIRDQNSEAQDRCCSLSPLVAGQWACLIGEDSLWTPTCARRTIQRTRPTKMAVAM